MIGGGDGLALQVGHVDFRHMLPEPAQGQSQHLIEIAVVDVALPIDTDEATAHDSFQVFVAVGVLQQTQVGLELAFGHRRTSEALDGHVGRSRYAEK